MRPYEIYNATFMWRNCADMRPWLIIGPDMDGLIDCFPISGENYYGSCYELNIGHPDFAATGLTKSCYVHYVSNVQVPKTAFAKRRGELKGDMLASFIEASGL